MSYRLRGAGVELEFTQQWLLFSWKGPWDEYVGGGGRLAMPPERCVSVSGRLASHDGSLGLVFRFRPTGLGGAGDITAEIVVGQDQARDAWQFTRWLAERYAIKDITLTGRDAGHHRGGPDGEPPARRYEDHEGHEDPAPRRQDEAVARGDDDPATGSADAQDWLSAPVSPATKTLFHSVVARLSGTDR